MSNCAGARPNPDLLTDPHISLDRERTIARGDPGCRVVMYLEPAAASEAASGREYFKE